MDPSCLQYVLTEGEKKTFNETGYLVLEDALPTERVEQLTGIVDQMYDQKRREGHPAQTSLFRPNFLPDHEQFLQLIDYEKVLPKVWGILGWNINIYHTHLIVTPPSGLEKNNHTFGWHQDSGRVNLEMESSPRPRLSIKVAYFLSDASEEGRGNFWIIPGSHLQDTIERPVSGVGQPEGAIPVKVKPGTAVIFDRRLWHSASPNWSEITRKVLFYGYGYRWLRTKDDMTVQHLWESCTPIQRQLLGYSSNCNGYFSPRDEDVPLKTWLEEHASEQVS